MIFWTCLVLLYRSAKSYTKIFKGSDHWLASDILLADELLKPVAHAIDYSVCSLAWPHQMLLVLNPELLKPSGGFRTIPKTPKFYKHWTITRRHPVALWERAQTNNTMLPEKARVPYSQLPTVLMLLKSRIEMVRKFAP